MVRGARLLAGAEGPVAHDSGPKENDGSTATVASVVGDREPEEGYDNGEREVDDVRGGGTRAGGRQAAAAAAAVVSAEDSAGEGAGGSGGGGWAYAPPGSCRAPRDVRASLEDEGPECGNIGDVGRPKSFAPGEIWKPEPPPGKSDMVRGADSSCLGFWRAENDCVRGGREDNRTRAPLARL